MRLREKITQRFDDTLDIRSFVSVQTNFATLISLLLTKEQMLLFKLNKNHSITTLKTEKKVKERKNNYFDDRREKDESNPEKFKFDLSQGKLDKKKKIGQLKGYSVTN